MRGAAIAAVLNNFRSGSSAAAKHLGLAELNFGREKVEDDRRRHVDDKGVVGSGSAVGDELGGLCRGRSEVVAEVVHGACHPRHGDLVHVVDDVLESQVRVRGRIMCKSSVTLRDMTEAGTSGIK